MRGRPLAFYQQQVKEGSEPGQHRVIPPLPSPKAAPERYHVQWYQRPPIGHVEQGWMNYLHPTFLHPFIPNYQLITDAAKNALNMSKAHIFQYLNEFV